MSKTWVSYLFHQMRLYVYISNYLIAITLTAQLKLNRIAGDIGTCFFLYKRNNFKTNKLKQYL